jgi:cytokinin dehydrogenase
VRAFGAAVTPASTGTLGVTEAALAAAAEDFGHHVHRRPLAVLRPGTASDVVEVVRFGRARGLRVVARGAGHSVDGQAQVRGGVGSTTNPGPNHLEEHFVSHPRRRS